MLATAASSRKPLTGSPKPRIAPPIPLRTRVEDVREQSAEIGIEPFPWQDTVDKYVWAVGPDGESWLYPEVAYIVARQNGKTRKLVAHIVKRLRMGRRIMHTAQNRELPREVFGEVARIMLTHYRNELASNPRFANGQEEIRLKNGGHYRIVAPTPGGARGPSNDEVIVDELRELEDHRFIAAAKPTLAASSNPQMIYLSNAGTRESAVLNALKRRASDDPSIAYLEWSAAPERRTDDIQGWLEANPSIGHLPKLLDNLTREHRAHKLGGTLAIFETEHLCRWVLTEQPHLLDDLSWARAQASLPPEQRPCMGIAMDPSGTRASAALAWLDGEGRISLRVLMDQQATALDTDKLGVALRENAKRLRIQKAGYDASSDKELVKYLGINQAINGRDFANASAQFVTSVTSGRLQWDDATEITNDLPWVTRKPFGEGGTWIASKIDDDHPTTAVMAAIRAVWLASGPSAPAARIY